MRKLTISIVMASVALSISGCDKTREALGLQRNMMDEFSVPDLEPLSEPPNYNLRPPLPKGADTTQKDKAVAKAQAALLGKKKSTTADISVAEEKLLAKAGVSENERDIRTKLANEQPTEKEASLGESLAFWKSESGKKPGDVIDPIAENERHRTS